MPWRIPLRAWRRHEEQHAEVEAARKESRETLHELADVTMQLLETNRQLKEALRQEGVPFDE